MSRGVWRSASAIELRFGWLVPPLIDAIAASAMSTPASLAFRHARSVEAAGVVRVKVNRDFDFFLQRFDQFVSGVGLAEAGHVFDGKKMSAELFELLGHRDVILQRILRARVVEDIAGVADRGFADAAGFERGVDRRRACCRWN